MDFYVETFRDRWTADVGKPWRASVIYGPTVSVMFTTWPYAHESSARDRAWRWAREEGQRREAAEAASGTGLFGS